MDSFQKLIGAFQTENGETKPLNEHYIDYIKSKEHLIAMDKLIALLQNKETESRIEQWQDLMATINEQEREDYLRNIANPFFVGYGNPNAELLIIGKELGFDKTKNTQFYNESIQNILLWENILKERSPVEVQHFNSPRMPYHGNIPKSSGHTWRLYKDLIKTLYHTDTLFDNCFITEYNHKPAPRSEGKQKLIKERKDLLKHDFYKKFKSVINTARSYDEGYTEEIFDVNWKFNIELDGRKSLKALFFAKDDRRVILTSQLSGLAGWSKNALHQLAELLNIEESIIELASQNSQTPKELQKIIFDKQY